MRNKRQTRLGLAAAALFACASLTCDSGDGLPGAPTTLTTGYVIYEGAGFAGTSAHLEADLADLQKPDGPCKQIDEADSWDDCVSSIRLSPGTRIVAFVDADFKGWGRTIDADVPDLEFILGPCRKTSMDDCISSIRLLPQ